MSDLNVKSSADGKGASVPMAVDTSISGSYRKGTTGRGARRRFNAIRLTQPTDSGFRLFRVY